MQQHLTRAGRVVLGVLFLILGVFGLFLPILQGTLFLIIGLALLSTESELARQLLHRLRRSRMVPARWREGKDDGERGEGSIR